MSIEFTDQELAAIRAEYCKGATDTQFELFISECKARNLRPGPHLVFQLRNAKEWDADTGASRFVKKPYWITTIGALRLIALRTGQYDGSSSPDYIYLDEKGKPTVVSQIPLPSKENKSLPREPWAVRVSVRRKDFSEPITSIVRFDSVAATQKRDNTFVLTEMWQKRGDAQNAKCSEADALRKAFPEELGSLYLSEEIKNETEDPTPHAVTPAPVAPQPPSVPKVDHTPATPTEAPRPNEPVIDKHLGPVPPVNPELTKVLAAVPDLKPASELPPPAKKRGGRPAKPQPSPDNGRNIETEGGITQADIDNLSQPAPEINQAENQKVAREFVEAVSSFTNAEAEAQGLPAPPDPLPDGKQKAEFIARVRALVEPGVDIKSLGDYTLSLGGKTSSKFLTVGDWTRAFENLDRAKAEGKLKEAVKGTTQPLPEF